MANFCCSSIPLRLVKESRFIGCDGKVLSNAILSLQLKDSLAREDYEDAAVIQKELDRRNGIHLSVQL